MHKIDTDSISKRFTEYFTVENNYRVIFSGKFGIGKSFFLNTFFDEQKEIYNKVIISPVNYSVSSNEDIFELIKADIIKDLFIAGKIDLTKLPEDNTLQKISSFVENNQLVLVNFMLSMLTKINPMTESPKKLIDEIGKIFKEYKNESKNKKAEEKTMSEEALEHWNSISEKIGSIYEYNYVTKVINSFLESIRDGGQKKNVLIIDDLDRIDPEHIFRILNILSAHNNHFEDKNKFEFDTIILVCDLENIKKIFLHRYGTDVDFEGYIDKFYSTHIFDFTNTDAIVTYVKSVFNVFENEKPYFGFITLVIQSLVEGDFLSVRKLLKHKHKIQVNSFVLQKQIGVNEDTFYMSNGIEFIQNKNLFVDSSDFKILYFFKMMTLIFGDFNAFFNCLTKLKSIKTTIKYEDYTEIISFLALQNHIATKTGDDLYFSKFYHNNGAGHLAAVNYPGNNYLGINFTIQLQWYRGNQYNGSISYFSKAVANETKSSDKQNIQFSLSSIFESIEKIALSCYEKGYLEKAGIIFKK